MYYRVTTLLLLEFSYVSVLELLNVLIMWEQSVATQQLIFNNVTVIRVQRVLITAYLNGREMKLSYMFNWSHVRNFATAICF